MLLSLLIIVGCSTTRNAELSNSGEIKKSCELYQHLNDTVVIRGYYHTLGGEYQFFSLIETDSCREDFNMHVDLSNCSNVEEYSPYFHQLGSVNLFMDITMKGVLKKERNYGHLGSNNSEFIVMEILEFEDYILQQLKKNSKKESEFIRIHKDQYLENMENN